MGTLSVTGRLTGPTGVSEAVELVVESGATLLVVPKPLADRLALEPRWVQRVRIAGGRVEEWPVGEVGLTLDGRQVTTPCFISPAGPALLRGSASILGLPRVLRADRRPRPVAPGRAALIP